MAQLMISFHEKGLAERLGCGETTGARLQADGISFDRRAKRLRFAISGPWDT